MPMILTPAFPPESWIEFVETRPIRAEYDESGRAVNLIPGQSTYHVWINLFGRRIHFQPHRWVYSFLLWLAGLGR